MKPASAGNLLPKSPAVLLPLNRFQVPRTSSKAGIAICDGISQHKTQVVLKYWQFLSEYSFMSSKKEVESLSFSLVPLLQGIMVSGLLEPHARNFFCKRLAFRFCAP
jgi:hypothetical protein